MTHPTGDDLILYHYGEAEDPAALDRHLAACGPCPNGPRAMAARCGGGCGRTFPSQPPRVCFSFRHGGCRLPPWRSSRWRRSPS